LQNCKDRPDSGKLNFPLSFFSIPDSSACKSLKKQAEQQKRKSSNHRESVKLEPRLKHPQNQETKIPSNLRHKPQERKSQLLRKFMVQEEMIVIRKLTLQMAAMKYTKIHEYTK
jgi:hypothetical protein